MQRVQQVGRSGTPCKPAACTPAPAPTLPRSAFAGYAVGLAATIVVMNVFQAAQPALLYIVPGVLGAVALHAGAGGRGPRILFADGKPMARVQWPCTMLLGGGMLAGCFTHPIAVMWPGAGCLGAQRSVGGSAGLRRAF